MDGRCGCVLSGPGSRCLQKQYLKGAGRLLPSPFTETSTTERGPGIQGIELSLPWGQNWKCNPYNIPLGRHHSVLPELMGLAVLMHQNRHSLLSEFVLLFQHGFWMWTWFSAFCYGQSGDSTMQKDSESWAADARRQRDGRKAVSGRETCCIPFIPVWKETMPLLFREKR